MRNCSFFGYTDESFLNKTLMHSELHAVAAAIKVPRNQTAAMQLLQIYAQAGHYYWTAGVVQRQKLASFIEKLAAFRIHRDKPGRVYDRSKGLASTHLVMLDSADDFLPWVMVSTKGKGGLADSHSLVVGVVHDTRLAGQHLTWNQYELLHAEKKLTRLVDVKTKAGKVLKDRKKTVRLTTWSWRMHPKRFLEHEALIVARAKQRDVAGIEEEMNALAQMPLFSGVRGQVLKLFAEAKKLCGKFSIMPPPTPTLPYMTRFSLYSTPPITLLTLLTTSTSSHPA
jgi:hypothetical protein